MNSTAAARGPNPSHNAGNSRIASVAALVALIAVALINMHDKRHVAPPQSAFCTNPIYLYKFTACFSCIRPTGRYVSVARTPVTAQNEHSSHTRVTNF